MDMDRLECMHKEIIKEEIHTLLRSIDEYDPVIVFEIIEGFESVLHYMKKHY